MIDLSKNEDKERIDNLIALRKYDELSKLSFSFDINELKENKYLVSWILKANLECKNYDLECFFIENLIRNGIESFEFYNYLFLCLLKIDDLFRIKSYMMKSKLLNDVVFKDIIDGDYSVLSSVGNMKDDDMITCILLVLFLNDFLSDYNGEKTDLNLEMICFYEMLDLAYSNGIEIEKLETIKYIGEVLFK